MNEAEQGPDRRRLACAVRPEKPGDDAPTDLKRQVVHGCAVPEALSKVFNGEDDLVRRGRRRH